MAQDYAKKFYNGKAWLKCRNAFMISKFNICERCGNIAVIVHHKKNITPENINDPNVTLSWDNLESLCIDCHNREHTSGEATAKGISFGVDGNIIYTPHSRHKNS